MSEITDRILSLVPDARLHKLDEEYGDKAIIIWGPPGTGKTTTLMTLVDAHLQFGAPSHQIMVATFTRNARAEVKARLAAKFGLMETDLPWVRTIHSSAYTLLDLSSEKVMGPRALEAFSRDSDYELRGQLIQRNIDDPFGGASVETFGDWCHAAEELRRAKLMSFKGIVDTLSPPPVAGSWDAEQAQKYSMVYANWKRSNYLYDFTDMLETVIEERISPPVNWMFVDEAQDLTPLQWKVVDLWSTQVARTFVFGDDDQAIFQFAGADPQALWERPGHQFVLSHSYRLPSAIHKTANALISRTGQRVIKAFEPHEQGGTVDEEWAWESLDWRREGSWLLLARNRIFLEACRNILREQGVPFTDRTSYAGMPPPASKRGRAIAALLDFHDGKLVTKRNSIRQLRDELRPGLWPTDRIGPQAVWSAVDLIDAGATPELVNRIMGKDPLGVLSGKVEDHNYLLAVMKREGIAGLTTPPRVDLSTIHGVKGEEADHVVVSTAMTRRTFEEYQQVPDPELRVFYVAATRAKKSLTWMLGGSRTYFTH